MSTGERLADKIAVVTGGSSGIGAETARQFAKHGATVVVCDLNEKLGQAVVDEIKWSGDEAIFRRLDVVQESEWEALMEEALERYQRLDILANSAGVTGRPPGPTNPQTARTSGPKIAEHSLEVWNRVMSVNSTGTFLGTKHSARIMAPLGSGSIINISSIWGIVGSFSSAAYHASKGSVRLLTKSAAIQCARNNIRVNSIHPGFVETPMTRAAHADRAVAQQRLDATPLRRFGTPYDIAMGCVYLASDESAWVTGSELVIDGGMTAR